jgi:tetratricopeptide (TPR) repeat protein
MGTVFLARDPELDRELAIKLVKDDLTDDPELRERFSREARSAARLRHPNIVTVFDIGEQDGCPFIAMEYLPGESLADKLKQPDPIGLPQILVWMEGLCLGLAHAHKAGIVHRDIKPANVMVDAEGTLKIVDFGIARLADSQMTREGMLVGTINYMSPEQILGRPPDHRADIFAVGAVFYELLAGRKAFPGTIADGLFTRLCQNEPEPLEQLRPGLDPEVVAIVACAIAKDPDARYQDLTTMARDIAMVRARVGTNADAGDTLTMAASAYPVEMTPDSGGRAGVRSGVGSGSGRLQVYAEEQQRQAALQAERDRAERLRSALERSRAALAQGACDQAVRAAEDALAVEPGLAEAHALIAQARAAIEDQQRQAAIDAARRVIDAARAAFEAGDTAGAADLIDAVKPPSETLAAEVAALRSRVAEQQRLRKRRVEIFVDAAELALSQGDYAKAAPLVEDAARVDPSSPAVLALRAQIEAHQAAAREGAARAQAIDAALREANGALARGDFAKAREHVAQARRIDPGSWNVSSVAGRIDQSERAAAERARRQEQVVVETRRRRSLTWVIVAVIVIAAVVAYLVL